MKKVASVVSLLIGVLAFNAFAQDAYLELLKSDIKTQKKLIIAEVMELSEQEASLFWPLYNEFEFELSKLQDAQFAVIKDYADNFESLTDAKAKELWLKAVKIREQKQKINKKFFKKMDKVLPSITVVKFFQVNNLVENLIQLQLSSSIPFVEKMDDYEEAEK